jgi:hypothetical protein
MLGCTSQRKEWDQNQPNLMLKTNTKSQKVTEASCQWMMRNGDLNFASTPTKITTWAQATTTQAWILFKNQRWEIQTELQSKPALES